MVKPFVRRVLRVTKCECVHHLKKTIPEMNFLTIVTIRFIVPIFAVSIQITASGIGLYAV